MRLADLRERLGRARNPDVLVTVLTALLAVGPYALDLFRRDVTRRVFAFAASDTFYYLTVARNAAGTGRLSFDGERLTNGFHPLWQLLLCIPAFAVRLAKADDAWILVWAIALGVVLVGLATVSLALAFRRGDEPLSPLFAALPAGIATAVQFPLMHHLYRTSGRLSMSLYGAVNGMETSLVLAAYGLVALGYLSPGRTRRDGLLLGGALAALALARLDHAAIAVTIAASLFLDRDHRDFARSASLVLGAALALYVVQNRLLFGAALPVSGTIKSTFPGLATDTQGLVRTFFTTPKKLPPGQGHRALALLLPGAFALGTIGVVASGALRRAHSGGPGPSRTSLFLACTAVGTLGIVLYDFCFVPKMNQGHWYFPVPNLLASLAVVEGTRGWLNRPKGTLGATLRALVLAGAAASSLAVLVASRPAEGDIGYGAFYFDEAPRVRAFYAGKAPKMVEFDDGILSFTTRIPSLSGTGLTVDAAAVPFAGKGRNAGFGQSRLLDLGLSRGYDRFATFAYAHEHVRANATDRELRRAYPFLLGKNAAGCTLAVDYYSPRGTLVIVRVDCPHGTPRL
ncbi:MAG TPA: hypothetical protein VHE30_08355 [Polyangiaceae bacterium]|nr:hypothetical protein [Polyangiaceae bacterium]